MVPNEIQCLWFTEVIHPAIKATSNPATMAYVDYTLDEWLWKAGLHSMSSAIKTTPIDSSKLDQLQDEMSRIINNRGGDLDMFGSFFFVMDSRGIKGSTTVIVGEDGCPYKSLCKNYPSLDWEFMMEREHGQLIMDLGLGFHPEPDDKQPCIGLWRLDKLKESYAAAGMDTGNIHHYSTFANYGSMQSEMPVLRGAAVQLCFRSTYNLIFEIVRHSGTTVDFCDDSDAYSTNFAYLNCLEKFQKVFMGAKEKSYGTREELRGSGLAIKQVLTDVPDMVLISLKTSIHTCLPFLFTDENIP
jgi:hypothetical protein